MNREVQDYKVYMNWVLHNEEKKLRSEGDGNLYVCVCVCAWDVYVRTGLPPKALS